MIIAVMRTSKTKNSIREEVPSAESASWKTRLKTTSEQRAEKLDSKLGR